MSQLLRRGLIAALAPTGATNIDIIASHPYQHVLTDIQVKTSYAMPFRGWRLEERHEKDVRSNLLYCFVRLEGLNDMPVTWIIPSGVVAETIEKTSRAYLSVPMRDGSRRQPGGRRWIRPHYPHFPKLSPDWLEEFKEAWHLITDRR